ncbi:hypothetical protein H920_16524 [Fukomys damarensis]|uniref:Uncharacterized protein n=1 Tax=Fukomys damarensis TaxID=885580 RepID=A0A091CUC5_FUKDA|nr:hypothetical protein H920_16524 [Fukomys damarensis]
MWAFPGVACAGAEDQGFLAAWLRGATVRAACDFCAHAVPAAPNVGKRRPTLLQTAVSRMTRSRWWQEALRRPGLLRACDRSLFRGAFSGRRERIRVQSQEEERWLALNLVVDTKARDVFN